MGRTNEANETNARTNARTSAINARTNAESVCQCSKPPRDRDSQIGPRQIKQTSTQHVSIHVHPQLERSHSRKESLGARHQTAGLAAKWAAYNHARRPHIEDVGHRLCGESNSNTRRHDTSALMWLLVALAK